MDHPILKIEHLRVGFAAGESGGRKVEAVNGVNLSVYAGQTLAVVGESGSGKSVTALSILRLLPGPPQCHVEGRIVWSPGREGDASDLVNLPEKSLRKVRGRQIAMIFQEPMTSLNPVYTIGEQILEAILLHQRVDAAEAVEIAVGALEDVGIAAARSRLNEYPHQLSGGMRQRVMIAMALACRPKLLLADEPTTALDVTIQAQILELLRHLQAQHGMAVMLITHDLGVVAQNADAVAVMYAGRVVEFASVHELFNNPLHPYTRGLFNSMPRLSRGLRRLETIPGSVPNPGRLPGGCAFHPRCGDVAGDARCSGAIPGLYEAQPGHWVACWHARGHEGGTATFPDVPHRRAETGAKV